MPHWKYILMTDEDNRNFCKKHFPDFLPYYDAFEYPIMRADAIRYMHLYIHGGLYIDLDIEVKKALDPFFYEDHDLYFVRSGTFGSYYTNALMAAKAKQPFFLKCIEDMKKPYKLWQVGKHLKVMGSTGPLLVSKLIGKSQPKFWKDAEYNLDIGELPPQLLTACSVCDAKPYDVSEYVRVLEGSSWIGNDTKCYIFFTCHWKKLTALILIIVIIYLVYYYSKKHKSI